MASQRKAGRGEGKGRAYTFHDADGELGSDVVACDERVETIGEGHADAVDCAYINYCIAQLVELYARGAPVKLVCGHGLLDVQRGSSGRAGEGGRAATSV
jgi:hypothetical protein